MTTVQSMATLSCYFSTTMKYKSKLNKLLLSLVHNMLIPFMTCLNLTDEQVYFALMLNAVRTEKTVQEFLIYYSKTLRDINKTKKRPLAYFVDTFSPWFTDLFELTDPFQHAQQTFPRPQRPLDLLAAAAATSQTSDYSSHDHSTSPTNSLPSIFYGDDELDELRNPNFVIKPNSSIEKIEPPPENHDDDTEPYDSDQDLEDFAAELEEMIQANSKSEPALACEAPQTHSVAQKALDRQRKHSRSQEKRNSKYSKSMLCSILEQVRLQKSRTQLMKTNRFLKSTGWQDQPCLDTIRETRDQRRIAIFLIKQKQAALQEFKRQRETDIHANGFLTNLAKKLVTGCCANKKDAVFVFLTKTCHLDEMTAMIITPIVKAVRDLLTHKITIGLALVILSYYLSKYIQLPSLVTTPLIAILLGYILKDTSQELISCVVSLYNTFREAYDKTKEKIPHLMDVDINQDTYKTLNLEVVTLARCEEAASEEDWRLNTLLKVGERNYRKHPKRSFKVTLPEHIHKFLQELDQTKLNEEHVAEMLLKYNKPLPAAQAAQPIPNGITEFCVDITETFQKVLSGIGLVSDTVQLPKALHFYCSTKKFVKQLYEVFTDLYPFFYEKITGKSYVDPNVAKYIEIFGTIAKKVHTTLKSARQSNIVKENAQFRLQIVAEYEALLESQMKLLELKAPPQYMAPIARLISEMSTLANECYSRQRGEASRPEPVLIFVRGPAGVGKTTMNTALAKILGQRLGFEVDSKTDFFIREGDAEHWDGYENQRFCVIDEAFQINDPEIQARTILDIIKIRNTAPFKLTMAALEAKKNSFFNSQFVFVTSNVANVTCEKITDIGAFYRRIDFDVFVASKPALNPDGTKSFDYEMTVNGEDCTVAQLADSIAYVFSTRKNSDADVAESLTKFVSSVPKTDIKDLIAPRDSTLNFAGKESDNAYTMKTSSASGTHRRRQPKPNGFTEYLKSTKAAATILNTTNYVLNRVPMKHYLGESWKAYLAAAIVTEQAKNYAMWLSAFAIGYGTVLILKKLISQITSTIFPNSKKEKDKLTGDKTTVVRQEKATVKDHLKAAQAAVDRHAVKVAKKNQVLKPNGSIQKWSSEMISYINEQGWEKSQWVADSLASIEILEEFEMTKQESEDLKRLKENLVDLIVTFKRDDELYRMWSKATVLNSTTLIATTHSLPTLENTVDLAINIKGKQVNIKNCKIVHISNSDTCIIELTTCLPCTDISYMFSPQSEVTAIDHDLYLIRKFDDAVTICPTTEYEVSDRVIQYNSDFDTIINCGSIFTTKLAVCRGDSGSLYLSRDHGRFTIVGMHVASSAMTCYGKYLTREMLKGYIKPPRTASTPYDNIMKAIDDNSRAFDQILANNSNCIPVGIVHPRTMISNRSKIARSILYHDQALPKATERPAVLKRTYNEDDPLKKANDKFRLRDEPTLEPQLQDEVVEAVLDQYPNTPVNKFYSNREAVEGNADMPKIAMTTSSGYPYSAEGKTPKTKLTDQDWADIIQEVDRALEDLYNGIPPQFIFQTSFKDELRPEEKVNKPRVINCAATVLTILFRRVLGPWMNMTHNNYNKLHAKVGINVHGPDWQIFFDRLVRMSHTNIVEIDYSGYEYNHPQFGYSLAARIIYRLYLRSGFSERDAAAACLLVQSCCGGYVLQNDVLIYVFMLLSGLPITAELNSLLNEIYQMICFRKLTNIPLLRMREFVESGYYGDDLLHSVHNSVAELFNAHTIQNFCKEFLSMVVTPASNKGGEMPKFVSILECSFLCRKFAPRENRVDAPLKLTSCTDSLQYYVPVAHMTQRELLASKCRSFITELTHYPPEIFDEWLNRIKDMKARHKLDFICYDYATALSRRVTLKDEGLLL